MTSVPTKGARITRFPVVLISVFIFILTMMTFVNAVNADFVNWDDDMYVTENPLVQSLSVESVWSILTTQHFYGWIPATLLSHAIDVHVWGMNPKGHHLTNIVLHGFNAVMMFLACLVVLQSREPSNNSSITTVTPAMLVGSCVASLLFALHPLRVESVAWVSGRKDLLCTLFLLPSFSLYLLWKLRGRAWLFGVSVLLFALALLAKPTAAPFPVILLLVDLLLVSRNVAHFPMKGILKDKVPFFLLSFIAGIITVMAAGSGRINVVAELSTIERLLLPLYMFAFYIWKTVVPVNLSPVYPELDASIFWAAPLLFVVVVVSTLVSIKRGHGSASLATFAYVLFLLPIYLGLSSGLQPIADRYSYIAVLGIFILIAAALEWLWRTSAVSAAKKYRRRTLLAVLLVLCAVNCYRTIRHVAVWDNSVSLWTQAVRYVPMSREEYEARRPFMKPDHLDALTNLGTAYYAAGNKGSALEQFRRILTLDEHSADAHYNIGNLLYESGDVEGSIGSFNKAIDSDSLYAKAYYNLGIISANKGESEQALLSLRRAAQLGFVDAQKLLQERGIGW